MRHQIAVVLLLSAVSATAAAQHDEPYFEDPEQVPAPQVLDIEDDPATRASASRVQVRKAPRRSSGFQVALDATAGYSWYRLDFLQKEEFAGFVYSTSLTFSWDTRPSRVGLVLRGFYAPDLSGSVQPFRFDVPENASEATADMWGLQLGFFAKYHGFYGTASLVFLYVSEIQGVDTTSQQALASYDDDTVLPELTVGLGYDIDIGDHFSLRLGGEAGTCFFATWRLAATGGLVVKF